MKSLWLIACCLLCSTATAESPAEQSKAKVVEVPLGEIWALNMPGTIDVRQLKADKKPESGSLVAGIGRFLANSPAQNEKAQNGFAVRGTGIEALRNAYAVMVNGEEPINSFPVGSDVSVVFFSHVCNYYVHLHKVERQRNKVSIRYWFVPHRTKELTSHFALIPVSDLAPGKVEVEISRSPMEQKFVDAGFRPPDVDSEQRIVSQSFRLLVEDAKK